MSNFPERPADDNPYGEDVSSTAIRGYRERVTPKSRFKVVEIDFTADPEKDNAEWLENQYRMLGKNKVRREVLRDWTVAAGLAFYSEYAENGGKERYGFLAKGLAQGIPVDVGLDFGRRMPAATWGQKIGNRAYILRELLVANIDAYSFFDLISFLSGTLLYEAMLPSAQEIYDQALEEGHVAEGPWFPAGVNFRYFAGPEIFTTTSLVKDGDPRSNDEIARSKGILIEAPRVEIIDRENVTRKLLHVDPQGRPAIFVDERCPNVHAMFNGGLAYPPPTKENPKPGKPRKDGKYDNIHDALTYWLSQTFSLTDISPQPTMTVYRNRKPFTINPNVETLAFHEARGVPREEGVIDDEEKRKSRRFLSSYFRRGRRRGR